MIYNLQELRIGDLVMKVHVDVEMPPDVLEFRDAEGNVLCRLTGVDMQQSSLPSTVKP